MVPSVGRLNILPAGMLKALRAQFVTIEQDVTGLIAALGRLADLAPAGDRAPRSPADG